MHPGCRTVDSSLQGPEGLDGPRKATEDTRRVYSPRQSPFFRYGQLYSRKARSVVEAGESDHSGLAPSLILQQMKNNSYTGLHVWFFLLQFWDQSQGSTHAGKCSPTELHPCPAHSPTAGLSAKSCITSLNFHTHPKRLVQVLTFFL